MIHQCDKCEDIGSLSKSLYGDLDCVYCPVAVERTALNDWLKQRRLGGDMGPVSGVDAWLIYQHGKSAASQNQ